MPKKKKKKKDPESEQGGVSLLSELEEVFDECINGFILVGTQGVEALVGYIIHTLQNDLNSYFSAQWFVLSHCHHYGKTKQIFFFSSLPILF